MKIQVISRETIKPSSPTPLHLRQYPLSFIDQISPPMYIPIIFLYSAESNNPDVKNFSRSDNLKKSLSETLTRFFPLAGRIKDGVSIDCNDAGVEYFETQVSSQLSEIMNKQTPDLEELKKLLPCEPYSSNWTSSGPELLLAIQVNFFNCGGKAICVSMSHKIGDVSSLATFVNTWASTFYGNSEILSPVFGLSSSLFPPKDILGMPTINLISEEKILIQRFVFDEFNIKALKEKMSKDSSLKDPTRVEAVSALLWKVFLTTVAAGKERLEKSYAALHTVNLRGRMDPPLPENSFGNIWWPSMAFLMKEDGEMKNNDLGVCLRDSIRKINGEFMKKLVISGGHLSNTENIGTGEVRLFTFSSWCRFPFYEADFGWGKPIWVCAASAPVKDVVGLMDTGSGDGIEAWVFLSEDDMKVFECDEELLSFVSSIWSD